MPEKSLISSALITRASDEFSQLLRSQLLIDLCLEEDIALSASHDRIELLLECYRARVAYHFDELNLALKKMRAEVEQA